MLEWTKTLFYQPTFRFDRVIVLLLIRCASCNFAHDAVFESSPIQFRSTGQIHTAFISQPLNPFRDMIKQGFQRLFFMGISSSAMIKLPPMLTSSLIIVSVAINMDGALSPNIWAKNIRPECIQHAIDQTNTVALNICNHGITCQPCPNFWLQYWTLG